jgi:hypothetical protein
MMELFIYLIKHYGLEEKARTPGCEIAITADSVKLDDYCIHITCGFKMTDKDARDHLVIDNNDTPKRAKLLFVTMQSERNLFPITSLAKDNKSTYNTFLRHIFYFGQELRDAGIPEIGWKPFLVAEPQYEELAAVHEQGWRHQADSTFMPLVQKNTVMIL